VAGDLVAFQEGLCFLEQHGATLKWIKMKKDRSVWTRFLWVRELGCSEHCNEPSGFIKCEECFD
jgi:hypothetical protein